MKSDDVATKIVRIDWNRAGEKFFGLVMLGDIVLKNFEISQGDYTSDRCAPCESQAKKLRNEIAKILREEYGE